MYNPNEFHSLEEQKYDIKIHKIMAQIKTKKIHIIMAHILISNSGTFQIRIEKKLNYLLLFIRIDLHSSGT